MIKRFIPLLLVLCASTALAQPHFRGSFGAGELVDAGLTADLTGALAKAADCVPCTLLLHDGVQYVWPIATEWANGLNLQGTGGHGFAWASPTLTQGAVITTSDNTRLIQATSGNLGQMVEGIFFADGLHIKKQRTTIIGSSFAGEGLLIGGAAQAPYYTRIINGAFTSENGGAAITCTTRCNGVHVDGNIFLAPEGGRGLVFDGTGNNGNRFLLSLDYDNGSIGTQDFGAAVYFDDTTTSLRNYIEFFYYETAAPQTLTDGAHIRIGANASENKIKLPWPENAAFRIWNQNFKNDIEINTYAGYRNSDNFEWGASYSPDMSSGSGTDNVYLPPVTLVSRKRTWRADDEVIFHRPNRLTAVAINAAGSGGVDGTYYQDITDSGDEVTNQEAMAEIVVVSGAIDSVTLLYPGWSISEWPATFNVTVGSVAGGVIDLTNKADGIDFVGFSSWTAPWDQTIDWYPDLTIGRWMPSYNVMQGALSFTNSDATPRVDVKSPTFITGASSYTITDFDNGVEGQHITVISAGAITYDTTATDLTGSSVDLVTADGDVTTWVNEDGTVWVLTGFVDVSVDNTGGA